MDAAGRMSVQTYDASGQLVAITDATGKKTYPGQNFARASEFSGRTNLPPAAASLTSTAAPIVIRVPADQPTIQAAIDVANNGDTVLVADGTYKENINFEGKAITVKSVHGTSKTVIDGGDINTVVSFVSGEQRTSVLTGFTIRNGNSNFNVPNFGEGGGIEVKNSSPTIINNVIRDNKACNGVGIGVSFGGPLIRNNLIINNTQFGCSGGPGGGGILVGGAPIIETQIIENVIENNSMPDALGGGGISLFAAGGPTIENNKISGNNGGSSGGGIALANDASPLIIENLFFRNTASQGGGIYWVIPVSTPGMLLVNNTIAQNSSANGSAIFDGGFDTNMTIENNLVIGEAGQSAYFCQQFNGNTTPAVFSHNDLFAAGAAGISGNCTFGTGSNGNISEDPKFFSEQRNDFHLQSGSPVIDAGNNSAPSLPARDFDGFPRIDNGTVDMGAYEFFPTDISLKPSSLTFLPQLVGTKSASQVVTVTNTGASPLLLVVSVTGDFLQINNCGLRVKPGSSCAVQIAFKPTAVGVQTGALLFADNAGASPQEVSLMGTGTAASVP